jgi:tetratricopeptide (TPR) repeat protein
MSAEDFARRRRRIVWIFIGAGALIALLVAWSYKRSTDPIHAREAYDAGERLLKNLRYTQAILSFDEAISFKPDLADAYLLRGRAHVIQGDVDPAMADFTKAIQLRPADAQAYVERGSLYLAQKDYQSAVSDSASALARNPQLAQAYNIRGAALRSLGEPSKALAEFNRAIELAPNADNYFQRAATYQLLDQHRPAIADLDQVIHFYPDSSEAYFARSRSKRALGDKDGATRDYTQGRILDGR